MYIYNNKKRMIHCNVPEILLAYNIPAGIALSLRATYFVKELCLYLIIKSNHSLADFFVHVSLYNPLSSFNDVENICTTFYIRRHHNVRYIYSNFIRIFTSHTNSCRC